MIWEYKIYRLFDSGGGNDNLKGLQGLLDDGWVPMRETPMKVSRDSSLLMMALVVLQREKAPDPARQQAGKAAKAEMAAAYGYVG